MIMDRILEESGVEKIVKTEEIFEYVQKQYGTVPEYLWSKSPDSAVLRHKNGKWYAVFMTVERKKKLQWLRESETKKSIFILPKRKGNLSAGR